MCKKTLVDAIWSILDSFELQSGLADDDISFIVIVMVC